MGHILFKNVDFFICGALYSRIPIACKKIANFFLFTVMLCIIEDL